MNKNLLACLVFARLFFFGYEGHAQSTIILTVTEVSTTIPDCDGFANDSDPTWYWTGADIDNNCYETVCNGCTESVSIELFNATYNCLSEVPASITMTFSGCENDGFSGACVGGAFIGSCDGGPGEGTRVLPVPTAAGTTILNFSDNSTGCVGSWSHQLEWNVTSNLSDVITSVTTVDETITADQSSGTYRWLDCNDSYSIIPGETAQSFTATATGSYAVELTNNGCVDTSACEVISSLPIELLSFEARRNQSRVDFKWVTATEINNDYFTIERSEDLDTWHEVFSLPGAGNSTEVREYTGSDDRPLVGTGYYRLKQTDFDGQYAYSKVEVVDGSTQSEIRLYPNPTTSELTIEGLGVDAKRISLLDVRGKDLTSQVYFSQDSGIRVVVDLANLRSGVYFIRVGGSVHTINKN